jgi:N-acyl-D-aspartate/D-glutamate deacylase
MLGRKGRMQMGADADITLFDPATIADTSTVEKPAQMSAGVQYVMVMGRLAKDPTGVIKDVRAGQAIKGQTV